MSLTQEIDHLISYYHGLSAFKKFFFPKALAKAITTIKKEQGASIQQYANVCLKFFQSVWFWQRWFYNGLAQFQKTSVYHACSTLKNLKTIERIQIILHTGTHTTPTSLETPSANNAEKPTPEVMEIPNPPTFDLDGTTVQETNNVITPLTPTQQRIITLLQQKLFSRPLEPTLYLAVLHCQHDLLRIEEILIELFSYSFCRPNEAEILALLHAEDPGFVGKFLIHIDSFTGRPHPCGSTVYLPPLYHQIVEQPDGYRLFPTLDAFFGLSSGVNSLFKQANFDATIRHHATLSFGQVDGHEMRDILAFVHTQEELNQIFQRCDQYGGNSQEARQAIYDYLLTKKPRFAERLQATASRCDIHPVLSITPDCIQPAVAESARRLLERYGPAQMKKRDFPSIPSSIDEMKKWAKSLPTDTPDPEKNKRHQSVFQALSLITQNECIQETYWCYCNYPSGLSISTPHLIDLYWRAIQDDKVRLVSRDAGFESLIQALHEILEDYILNTQGHQRRAKVYFTKKENEGDDVGYSYGISLRYRIFNKFIEKLVGIHPDAAVDLITPPTAYTKLLKVVEDVATHYVTNNVLETSLLRELHDVGLSVIWPMIVDEIKSEMSRMHSDLYTSKENLDAFSETGKHFYMQEFPLLVKAYKHKKHLHHQQSTPSISNHPNLLFQPAPEGASVQSEVMVEPMCLKTSLGSII